MTLTVYLFKANGDNKIVEFNDVKSIIPVYDLGSHIGFYVDGEEQVFDLPVNSFEITD